MPNDPTAAPHDLDQKSRALYNRLRKAMRDDRRWVDTDMHLLTQGCRYEMRARVARDLLPKDKQGRPVMYTRGRSENSGDVQHPLVRIMETAEKGWIDCLDRLGFGPKARAQLGIEARREGGGKFGLD